MTFWSDKKLAHNLSSVIDPYEQGKIDTSGYRLSIGDDVYITAAKGEEQSQSNGRIIIPPGQFALLTTKEKVTVPKQSIGFISIRAKIKFRGLINVSGFHVDPGFSGHLIFSVFNAGPKRITLQNDEDIFLIWFADLDQENDRSKGSQNIDGKIPSELINNINIQVDSPAALNERLTSFEKLSRLVMGAGGTVLAVVIGIGGWAVNTLIGLDVHAKVADKNFESKISETSKDIDSLKAQYQSLKFSFDGRDNAENQLKILESINSRLEAIEKKQQKIKN